MLPVNRRELERREHELYVMAEVAKTLTSALDLSSLLTAALQKIASVLEPVEAGAVMLWDHSAGLFRAQAAIGYDFTELSRMGLRKGESITGKVFDSGTATLLATPAEVAEAMADMRPANRAALARALRTPVLPCSALAAPLGAGERKLGVLVLMTLRGPALFQQSDLPFIQTLAELIALAIDRDRLEQEAKAILQEQQSDRLRSEAMAALSHELRTPLAAIKGYASALLLEEIEWPAEKRSEFLHLIDQECDNLQTMIGDLLDSALMEVGQLRIERQPVRLERLAQETAEEMQRRTEIHRLALDFPPSFPIVDADHARMRQVLRNILDNAIKYSPNGGLIVIRGAVRESNVVLSISDQGVGISPEDLIPLFEKYFRVKSPTGFHVAGTGLGLPVARALVEAHGGRIWAESKVGQGTTLFFSLPRSGWSSESQRDHG